MNAKGQVWPGNHVREDPLFFETLEASIRHSWVDKSRWVWWVDCRHDLHCLCVSGNLCVKETRNIACACGADSVDPASRCCMLNRLLWRLTQLRDICSDAGVRVRGRILGFERSQFALTMQSFQVRQRPLCASTVCTADRQHAVVHESR